MKSGGISNSQNYQGLFQNWEIAIAKKLIIEFQASSKWLRREDFDDLLQKCLTHWYFNKGKYGSNHGASIQTFMGKVVRNKLKDLIREHKSDKRQLIHIASSLDDTINDDENSPALINLIESDGLSEPCLNSYDGINMKTDLEKVKEKLTARQKELITELQYSSILEVSRTLGIPRSTLNDEIKRIRKIFQKMGLKVYLE